MLFTYVTTNENVTKDQLILAGHPFYEGTLDCVNVVSSAKLESRDMTYPSVSEVYYTKVTVTLGNCQDLFSILLAALLRFVAASSISRSLILAAAAGP